MNSADLQMFAQAALEKCSECKLVGEIALTRMVENRYGVKVAHRTCRTCLGFREDPVRLMAERQIVGKADERRLAPSCLQNRPLEWDGATPVRRAVA